jgi:hypothetical protein
MIGKRIMLLGVLFATLTLAACARSSGGGQGPASGGQGPGGIQGGDGGNPGAGPGGQAAGGSQVEITAEANGATAAPTIQTTAETTTEVSSEAFEVDTRGGGQAAVEEAWAQIDALDQGMPFKLTISEAELEAMITAQMEAQGLGEQLSEFNISLDNQQVGVTFTLTPEQGPRDSVSASVVFNASIDENGDLKLEVASAAAGRAEIPPEALAGLSDALAEAMTGASANADADVTLTELVIDDGLMTIKGYVK